MCQVGYQFMLIVKNTFSNQSLAHISYQSWTLAIYILCLVFFYCEKIGTSAQFSGMKLNKSGKSNLQMEKL